MLICARRIPLVAKWMTAVQTNTSASSDCIIDSATVEYLAVNHQYAPCLCYGLWSCSLTMCAGDYSAIPQPW